MVDINHKYLPIVSYFLSAQNVYFLPSFLQNIQASVKERRGMMEEPIFRPDSARDPQYMYRGRRKRAAPIPPFVQKNKL